MLKLLIADDEKTIRESICHLIDWKSYDIEVIGTAKNGIEAYHMILDLYPDIVLTDIRMPGLSGLDLIEKMHEVSADTLFIILSGYNEFEYAKTAMQYGIRHYLLKPCSEQQIIESILAVKKEYQARMLEKNFLTEHNQLKNQLYTGMLINIINRYLAQNGQLTPEIEDSFYTEFYRHFHETACPYEVCYLYYVESHNHEETFRRVSDFLVLAYPGIQMNLLYVKNTLVIFFRSFSDAYDELTGFLTGMTFEKQATSPVAELYSYPNLKSAMHKIAQQIRRYEEILYFNEQTLFQINNYDNILRDIQSYADRIFHHTEKADEYLSLLLSQIENIQQLSFLKQIAPSLIMNAASALPSFGISDAVDFLISLDHEADMDLYRQKLMHQMILLKQIKDSSASTGEISDKIKKSVQEHISNPELSLKWIAEHELYMNVDYISKKFVKETGQKFSAYLTEMRIKKAKELLAGCHSLPIADVAEFVGCGNNPMYFSQIFKKYTGMSPSSYIKTLQG
mgnify:FL=1